jgi:hypothetical protein
MISPTYRNYGIWIFLNRFLCYYFSGDISSVKTYQNNETFLGLEVPSSTKDYDHGTTKTRLSEKISPLQN